MARLIDANAAIKAMNAVEIHFWEDAEDGVEKCVNILHNAKTVNAVEVVRCRECKHWKPTGSKAGNSFSDMEYIGGCEFTKYCRRESDFCSYGERKDGDGNG